MSVPRMGRRGARGVQSEASDGGSTGTRTAGPSPSASRESRRGRAADQVLAATQVALHGLDVRSNNIAGNNIAWSRVLLLRGRRSSGNAGDEDAFIVGGRNYIAIASDDRRAGRHATWDVGRRNQT